MTEPASSLRHTLPILVQPADIDELGHVNNVVYVRWAQEVAASHWRNVAPNELQQQYVWVVLRHEIDYRAAARLNDEVTGVTWVEDFSGVKSRRRVQFFRGQQLLAECLTTWCLLDTVSQRPARIPESMSKLFRASS